MQNNGHMTSTNLAQYGPKLLGPVPGPKARAIVAGDERYVSPSYTRSYPMVAKRGRGVRVEDVDGNEFLDFAAGIAVVSTGHCHPEVVAAIQQQAAELIHISGTDFYYEHMVTLAERLSAIAPMPGPHRFYYGNSGAEAIECALKLARYHTGRQNIISFFGAFHGRTMGALSLTASKPQQRRRFAPLVPGVTHVRYPYAYRGCSGGPQEEERFALGCARYIEEKLFKTTLPPEEVAAIFVEPIQGVTREKRSRNRQRVRVVYWRRTWRMRHDECQRGICDRWTRRRANTGSSFRWATHAGKAAVHRRTISPNTTMQAHLVCGCGASLSTLHDPERFVTIGVNDVGRLFQPDYLVVVNPRNQFHGDRFRYVDESGARAIFTQLDLGLSHPHVVRFQLGKRCGVDFSNPNVLHYTTNSPYVAL